MLSMAHCALSRLGVARPEEMVCSDSLSGISSSKVQRCPLHQHPAVCAGSATLQHLPLRARRPLPSSAGVAVWSGESWITEAALIQTISMSSTVDATSWPDGRRLTAGTPDLHSGGPQEGIGAPSTSRSLQSPLSTGHESAVTLNCMTQPLSGIISCVTAYTSLPSALPHTITPSGELQKRCTEQSSENNQ
ncbi:hypothetical protein F7725_023064 [Dissostichus mawsoni]|uniref:Uncharacterized protein n=1 Tax=Dissostichus mawsoni TaxID=36200 RepID=A0A7J5Z1T6_DISMA|nr:hypothetical protein F7725_023064 [Dissostichus mawsoni]